jgi:hypothetical protein
VAKAEQRWSRVPAVLVVASLMGWLTGGCLTIKTEPIQINVDVTIRIQKELDNFFGDIDKKEVQKGAVP